MDGQRFDALTRAAATSRRRFLSGLLAGVVGMVSTTAGSTRSCTRYGRPCTNQTCCGGATCDGGICRCPAGTSTCNAPRQGPICVSCPPGQVLGAGCRCRCEATGAPAGECCADADCGPDAACQDGACVSTLRACPLVLGFAGRDPVTGDCGCASGFSVACGALCCPAGETCVSTANGGVQCSGETRAGQQDCAGGCAGCEEFCANPPAVPGFAPNSTCCAREFDFTCCPPNAICTPFGGCCCPVGADCPRVGSCGV